VYDEKARLAALLSYSVLPLDPGGGGAPFDELVRLAAEVACCPTSLITLVSDESQHFKAQHGLGMPGVDSTSRSVSFCNHAIIQPEALLVVEDTTKDPRFSSNPLVAGPPHVRFYAGQPLVDPDTGQALGTLCVLDYVPRQINDLQRMALHLLSRQVMAAFESRRRILTLEATLTQLEETRKALHLSTERAERALALAEQANRAKSQFLANSKSTLRLCPHCVHSIRSRCAPGCIIDASPGVWLCTLVFFALNSPRAVVHLLC
jgi:GAF domain-containing protein